MKIKEYIVYDNRTDNVLAVGTARECTKQLGYKTTDVFYTLICRQRERAKGIIRGNRYMSVYEIEDD